MIKNFKARDSLMQNFVELDIKKILDRKAMTFMVWSLKTSLTQIVESNKIIKSYKFLIIS